MDKRKFTLQLLAEVSGKPSAAMGNAAQKPAAPRRGKQLRICPKLLVLSDAAVSLEEAEALRRCGYILETVTDPMAAIPDSPDLIVMIPSPGLVAELAMGLQSRPMAAAILQALWNGKPVYADFSALGGCASPALQALYAGYADRLREFGVKEIFPGHYEDCVLQKKEAAPQQQSVSAAQSRIVITQQDVLSFAGTHWQLPENAIITPLARDTAAARGVVLEKVQPRRD